MKSFTLICDQGHEFDLMVKSLDSLQDQQARGLVTCPYCDSTQVTRTLARPTVQGGKGRGKTHGKAPGNSPCPPTTPHGPLPVAAGPTGPSRAEMEQAYKFFSEFRSKVEETHENVGKKFSDQARAMHYGEIEERGIYGEASQDQVQDLIDEGIDIAPLPNLPKTNA